MKRTLAIGVLQLCTGSKPVGADGRHVRARPGGEDSHHQTLEPNLYQGCRARSCSSTAKAATVRERAHRFP